MVDIIEHLLHQEVINHLEKPNTSYKIKADYTVFLRKSKLPANLHNKLSNKNLDHLELSTRLEKIPTNLTYQRL